MRALRWLRGHPSALRSPLWLNWIRSSVLLAAALLTGALTAHAWRGLMEAALALRAPSSLHYLQAALGLLLLGLLGLWVTHRHARAGGSWQRLSDTRLKASIGGVVAAHTLRVTRLHQAIDILAGVAAVATGSVLLTTRGTSPVPWIAALAALLLLSGVSRYVSERYAAAHTLTTLTRNAPRTRRKRRA